MSKTISSDTKRKRFRRNRRRGPRRSLWASRLTRNIFLSNLIGLIILVAGTLAMSRFEVGLINAKIDNIQSLAATITTVIGEQATGYGGMAELDVKSAQQILRGVNVQDGWRVRLHDKSGSLVADTKTLDGEFFIESLDPVVEERPGRPKQEVWRENIRHWFETKLHNLPWRRAKRENLRRNLKSEVRAGLNGETSYGPRYDAQDNLIVTVSLPVRRVQQVLGVVTVESNDVGSIVTAERKALAPIIVLAFLAMFLSSLALTLFISLPMRRLARAAEIVTRSAKNRDAIPDLSNRSDEIGDLSLVLKDMTEGLYNRIDDIANFAADVAHEIKNPLTSLRSASDTLRVAKTEAQREKLIDIIQQDVSRMDRLISDISKASKVDANLARETAKTLDVGEIAENIVEFYKQTRSKDGADVINASTLDLDAPIYIRAYESPFAQVLRNLIDNALTFSPDDGDVIVTAKQSGSRVFFTVEDDGPGIPEDNLETVFERFYTQRPKGASFGSHSGLGLAICRQIITAHRGKIYAENRKDNNGKILGAKFTIDVPRQKSSAEV